MKKNILLLILVFPLFIFSQVGINTTNPSSAAVLHLEALSPSGTYGGFMPPRVSLVQRDAIPVSADDDGLMVYLIEGTTRCLQIYETASSSWVNFYCMPVASASITYYQDFEASSATPTLSYTGGSGSITSGDGLFPVSPLYAEGAQGYGVNNLDSSITFDPIDTSSYTSADLTFNLASFAGTSGNGSDGSDEVEILVSVDNVTWSSEIIINGNNNAKWDFSGTGIASANFDGNNSPTGFSAPSGGYLTGADAYSNVSLTGLPITSTLYIQIRMFNNSSNETWVIDNVVLSLN